MGWGLIVFVVFFLAALGLLAVALCILFASNDERKEPPYRLGHTMWLCAGCHKAYDHLVQQCPRGHPVIEVAAWQPTLERTDRYDPYATALMTSVGRSDKASRE